LEESDRNSKNIPPTFEGENIADYLQREKDGLTVFCVNH